MKLTRRGALIGASAAVVVTGVPGAVQGGDTVLLAQVARFHDLYGEWRDVWAKQKAHRARVEAMADCPELDATVEGSRAHLAFLEAHDAYRYYDESGRLGSRAGALAKAVFETPAETAKGALEKLKIAYMAVGDGEGTMTGDIDLEAYQEWGKPWMATVVADFERLIGGMRP